VERMDKKETSNKYIRGFKNNYFTKANLTNILYKNGVTDNSLEDIVKKVKSGEFFFGIRNNYVDIYEGPSCKWKYSKLKKMKSDYNPKCTPEATAQWSIVANNNSNPDANWYCYDIECPVIENTGRQDILAVDHDGNLKIIELKYKTTAYNTSKTISKKKKKESWTPGIEKHYSDFFKISKNPDNLIASAINILRIYKELGVLGDKWKFIPDILAIKNLQEKSAIENLKENLNIKNLDEKSNINFYFLTVGLSNRMEATKALKMMLKKLNNLKSYPFIDKDFHFLKAKYCFTNKFLVIDNEVKNTTNDLATLFNDQETIILDENLFFTDSE
jgi:hypothetical protein